ncbi:MAG: Acetyl-CoA C-acyltransferase [Actinomycetia bacterium]|nr:Acetyl-CoA C-acyltransferase [Actinomycetes bacterium]
MEAREAVIVDVARTAFGKRKGALANWHPTDLLGLCLRAIVERNDIDPATIDDVVGGCVTQAGEQGCNVTRNAWVAAGLPWQVPATSVDRQCGSSQQAAHFVAQGVIAGAYDIGIACGVESMTRAPMSSNARGGTGPFSPGFLENTSNTLGIQFWVAQVLADKWGITRTDMDTLALQSHARAAENTDNGFFAGEIVPVPLKAEDGSLTGEMLTADEGIRRGGTMEKLASLPPAWVSDDQPASEITAANSSQMTDGASAMIIAERSYAERLGLPIRARFHAFAVAAEDPVLVLSAPVPVTYKLMERSGMKPNDWDAVECNEAFAAIALMWQREFDYPIEQFNPRGGAIALGHPLGASGVALMTRLLRHLEATGGRYGFQTMCEGGGQANATVIERLT